MSEKDAKGAWSEARALTWLNTPTLDYCPSFSPDGKFLWFTSRRKILDEDNKSYKGLSHRLQSAGNGLDDIYWVRADLLAK